MKRTRFTEEQITYALRQVESGIPPADVCRQLGCSEASFYNWKKRNGNLGMTEVKELRQLRDENARLSTSSPISRSTNISCRRSSEKSFEADTSSIAGELDA